jgi:hypothetical protein
MAVMVTSRLRFPKVVGNDNKSGRIGLLSDHFWLQGRHG